ncbi:MAG: purine-nucleoside phosphorylase [Vicinamibacterales bacterium]
MNHYDQVKEAADAVRARVHEAPSIGVVLGSGLGGFAGRVSDAVSLPYQDLPHWPRSRVPGHEGRLVAGTLAGCTVAVLAGRCHSYEGHDLHAVTFAVRVLGLLGTKVLILTNAAGGINTGFASGDLMIIDDHINLMGSNPLVGPNDDRFGPRFPDMTDVYSARLRAAADRAGRDAHVPLRHGVYASLAGPSYETPAEIRYLRVIGADAVGMSTVPEAIVARHMGIEVLAISCISNMAAGIEHRKLDHTEVVETTARVGESLARLLEGTIGHLRA